jgi:hypothetical protein
MKDCREIQVLMAVSMKTAVFWEKSWDSSVRTVTGYRPDSKGAIPGRGKRISPLYPDRLWGPHSLLHNGYQELKAAEA